MQRRQQLLISTLAVIGLAATSGAVWAQQDHAGHDQDGSGGQGRMMQQNGTGGGMMNRDGNGGGMNHGEGEAGAMGGGMMRQMHANMHSEDANSGQSAFDLISQVVDQLEANPDTNWELVNIDALRQHLVDMNEVTMNAEVDSSHVDGGARYVVTGKGRTRDAIKRMVPTHALQIQAELGWKTETEVRRNGVVLVVSSDDPATTAKLRGLGFMGFMVAGEHHADHHLMMAGGQPQSHGGMNHGQGNGSGQQGQNGGHSHADH